MHIDFLKLKMYFKWFLLCDGLISFFLQGLGYFFFFLRYEINFRDLKQLTLRQMYVASLLRSHVNVTSWHILEK